MKQAEEELLKAWGHIRRLSTMEESLRKSLEIISREEDEEKKVLLNKGAASDVQACYTGVETLLEAALKSAGIKVPKGEACHKELLEEAVAHKLITDEQKTKLDEIRALRHKTRHIYDLVLNPDILRERMQTLIEVLPGILTGVEEILKKLPEKSEEDTLGEIR